MSSITEFEKGLFEKIERLEKEKAELIDWLICDIKHSIDMWQDACWDRGETSHLSEWKKANPKKTYFIKKHKGKSIEELLNDK